MQQQTQPKVMKKIEKGATGQSFIREEVTSYKIHTLGENSLKNFHWFFGRFEDT